MHRSVSVRSISVITIVLALGVSYAAAQDDVLRDHPGPQHIGHVLDSSTRHLLISGGLQGTSVLAMRADPRILMRLSDAAVRAEAEAAWFRERQSAGENPLQSISGSPRRQWLRLAMEKVPLLLLATASAGESGAEALLAAGVFEVVHRPLISAELASALARCLTVSEIPVRELQP